MKNYLIVLIISTTIFSCNVPEKSTEKDINLISIYNGIKKDSVFKKFIGYHIVRRDGEDQYFYNDLRKDSISWQPSVLYDGENKKLDGGTELLFEKYPIARLQFDIMRKYDISAVITDNYNPETMRLEYNEYGGHDFSYYVLTFALSDSMSINNINFDKNEYNRIIKNNYKVVKTLDSNWFVLKHL